MASQDDSDAKDMQPQQKGFVTKVTRNYIDIRPFAAPETTPASSSKYVNLPLIETLPTDLQESIRRYIRAPDKFMSLASALLKYQFIHRNAKIPWSQVRISKTPKPHSRPYWDPPLRWSGENGTKGLEFNVSHQAGIVVLVGAGTPSRPVVPKSKDDGFGGGRGGLYGYGRGEVRDDDDDDDDEFVDPDPATEKPGVRIGVDVACTREYRRTPDLSTQAKLDEWVDTFGEMFSERERRDMKSDPNTATAEQRGASVVWNWKINKMEAKGRRFYTCWALKEAYIKMVGEGLLADWLRDLEFINVVPPQPGQQVTPEETGMQILFEGKDITDTMKTVLEGLEDNFVLATMMRGIAEEGESEKKWARIDIDGDIRPCAEGTCSCLL